MRALFLHSKHHLPLKHALQEKEMLLSSEQKLREQISETVSPVSGILRHFVALICLCSWCAGDKNAHPVGKQRCHRRSAAEGITGTEEIDGRD